MVREVRAALRLAVALVMLGGWAAAQDAKPVPKGSVRVSIPGCSRGYIFTTGPRSVDEAGTADVPDGLRLRMNGPKKLIGEIKAHEGSMITITGTMKEGQFKPGGINFGGGVRIGQPGGGPLGNPIANQIMIDVEGWRPSTGSCPSKR